MTVIFMEVTDPDVVVGDHPAVTLTDGVTETVYQQLYIPFGFSAVTSLRVFIVAGGNGNIVVSALADWGRVHTSEPYNQHSDSMAATAYAVVANNINCIDISAITTGITIDDLLGISFTREGGNGLDTVDADCYYLGLELVY